jgi:hypothetical protein
VDIWAPPAGRPEQDCPLGPQSPPPPSRVAAAKTPQVKGSGQPAEQGRGQRQGGHRARWCAGTTSTSRLASTCQAGASLLLLLLLRLLRQCCLDVGRTWMQRPPQATAVAMRGSAWLGPMAAAGRERRVNRSIACRACQRNNGLSTLRMASTGMCSAAWATALKPRRYLYAACRQPGLSDRSGPRSTNSESGARWCARGCTTSRAAATWHSRREARRSSSWRRCKAAPSVPRAASRCS